MTATAGIQGQGAAGGRVYFSGASRSLVQEDEITLTSVGVDIGSSTSHLLFSRITLERLDTRYIVADREVLFQSEILLTPYHADEEIDGAALGVFIEEQYRRAGIAREAVDAGALILTGVAVRRANARAIGDLFSSEAGKFVAVSAGDGLETLMAAHGSGAVEASRGRRILNIDIGGGTTKIALCEDGRIAAMTAVETGARLIVRDDAGLVTRLERFGAEHARALGHAPHLGAALSDDAARAVAEHMADLILAAIDGTAPANVLRLPGLPPCADVDGVIFSGGVSEYVYGTEATRFGDLGPDLAAAVRERLSGRGLRLLPNLQGIRATVVGASQYTVQVSGSTVFLDPLDTLPLRNVATISPDIRLEDDTLDPAAIAAAIEAALLRLDLGSGRDPVAVTLKWGGSATYHRLAALAKGLLAGLAPVLKAGHPLVIVTDGDIGGLLGMHLRESEGATSPIVSIDGIDVNEFDFLDIGEVLMDTGAVPVVVKSLVFPAPDAQERAA
jgi:ethanolamine utilization protein EutA